MGAAFRFSTLFSVIWRDPCICNGFHNLFVMSSRKIFKDWPVDGDADDDVAWEEESEDAEEGADAAEEVAPAPRHRRVPTDLQRHHQERHLKHEELNDKRWRQRC